MLFTSCEKKDDSIIDPNLTFPNIISYYINPDNLNSDTVYCIAGATVQSEEAVSNVSVKFYSLNNTLLFTTILSDNGVYPDSIAGDGRYTGIMNYVFQCREVGNHVVEFIATNRSGLNSPPILTNVTVIRNPNNLPVVSNLIVVPESTRVNQDVFLIFMVTATDTDGQCDIEKVFYTGFQPNGNPLTLRKLYDDGSCCLIDGTNATSGDTTANDTKFTRKLFGAPNQTGYYRYFIRAVDRSGDTSNVLSDSIFVYP